MKEKEVLEFAKQVALKFINKVETGRAHSKETYSDMKELVQKIGSL